MSAIPEPTDQRAAALSMFGDDTQPAPLDGDDAFASTGGGLLRPSGLRYLLIALLLALPFAAISVWLNFLQVQINTFHANDETIFHLGVIRKFAAELPFPNLYDYNSATTPLFHLVYATAMRLFDLELPGLRLMNVVISYGLVLYLFHLFRQVLELPRRDAVLATVAFGLSPYFFGASFLALTDNFAWALAVLTLGQALKAQRANRPVDWLMASVLCALTLLARQNYVWLFIGLAGLAFSQPGAWRDRAWRTAIVLASALPIVPLILAWGGPVPPTFQAGGTSGIEHLAGVHVNMLAVNFLVALVGAYELIFPMKPGRGHATHAATAAPTQMAVPYAIPISLAATAVMLLAWPMHRDMELHNGILWTLGAAIPGVFGSSLLFWVLMPFGVHRLLHALRGWPQDLSNSALVGLLATALLASAFIFQKYFDPAVPLLLAIASLRHGAPGRRERIALGLLVAGGVLYFLAQTRLTQFG